MKHWAKWGDRLAKTEDSPRSILLGGFHSSWLVPRSGRWFAVEDFMFRRFLPVLLPLGTVLLTLLPGAAQEVTSSSFSGDGGPAVKARLNYPVGLAVDGDGSVYIADTYNYRIRRVDPAGTISTLAGNGERGFSGDGGPAVEARLNYPVGVTADGDGNVYIADAYNYRIRRVDPAGTISTLAGNGERGFSGDGGPAVEARLNDPWDVTVDEDGNVYIADSYNHRVRRVDPSGIISTFAGNGPGAFAGDGGPAVQARLNNPVGLAVDGDGNLYIADNDNDRVRRVDPTGIISTFAGNGPGAFTRAAGPAVEHSLGDPVRLAVDGGGKVYITDSFWDRVLRVDPAGTISNLARFSNPKGVAVDGAGNLYIADTSNHLIRRVDPAGTITTFAGNGQRQWDMR